MAQDPEGGAAILFDAIVAYNKALRQRITELEANNQVLEVQVGPRLLVHGYCTCLFPNSPFNFPTPLEMARYDAVVARMPRNNKCNAGNPAVWGELLGDGFECDANCAQCMYEREDDENVQDC